MPEVAVSTTRPLAEDADLRSALLARYKSVRGLTMAIAEPLSDEDQCVQAMEDTSPIKWHLGHTTWFFETVVLANHIADFKALDEQYLYHFNSYYESLGPRQPRPHRGLITRPSNHEVKQYRLLIDEQMENFLSGCSEETLFAAAADIELGLNHEQQHQELMLTDLKYLLYQNPFEQIYIPLPAQAKNTTVPMQWLQYAGGIKQIGHNGDGFSYDNECPRHDALIHPYQLANRLVTCGEYLDFINDGGYKNPAHWLSDGWAKVNAAGWHAPLYWREASPGQWRVFTLHGFKDLDPNEPVTHVSYYEAMAYASWAEARLPREFELELALENSPEGQKNFGQRQVLHPQVAKGQPNTLLQGFGETWQWTSSSYDAYPGFKPFAGAVAEYNGKFMVGQLVLRGSSCATPAGHTRTTYRNFFPPAAQWQFFGIRLAKDV